MNFTDGNAVEPFLEDSETYPALESAIVEAHQTVHMAYWTIDPTLDVISDHTEGNWASLIADTVRRGVTVRLVIADFDPILGRKYHRSAWSSYLEFMKIREKLPREAQAGLQVICWHCHINWAGRAVQSTLGWADAPTLLQASPLPI